MKEIYVKNLMSKDVTCLPPDSEMRLAVKLMVAQHYSCIVISRNDLPIGIVTERDLVKVLNGAEKEIDLLLPVSDFMSSPIISLNENDTLFDAMVISRAQNIRHIPVINNDEHLVGLVTYSDLVNAHFKVIDAQSDMIEKLVSERTDKLEGLNKELQALSLVDHLMQIGNRRAMEVDLGHTHSSSKRYGQPYSVLLMDVDYFKRYNDHYGHQAGDDALKLISGLLKESIRGSDRIYRYGGEELLIVLPNTSAAQADKVAQKLVSAIFKSSIAHEKSSYEYLTISSGGACVLNNGQLFSSWEKLVEQADHNLYQAKNGGRNRSVVS